MIESFQNRENILDNLDPRAGSFKIYHVTKYEDQPNVHLEVELGPCDEKELTKSLDYDETTFTGMSCIKDDNDEVIQGLLFDKNRKSINIEISTC